MYWGRNKLPPSVASMATTTWKGDPEIEGGGIKKLDELQTRDITQFSKEFKSYSEFVSAGRIVRAEVVPNIVNLSKVNNSNTEDNGRENSKRMNGVIDPAKKELTKRR